MNLEAKDPAEYITVTFPYADEIGTATISSAVITIAVSNGADAAVANMPEGAAAISGSNVLQMFKLGVTTVDYLVRCLATLNDGRKLLRWAILPVRSGA